jgi:ArsR family transcriptional regulator
MAKRIRHLQPLARVFRILGDETRLRILLSLRDGEMNVSSLCNQLKVPQPTVSHHLGILRMGGMVENRRSGKEIYYSVREADRELAKTIAPLMDNPDLLRLGPVNVGLVN